jgi:hypothetical protein
MPAADRRGRPGRCEPGCLFHGKRHRELLDRTHESESYADFGDRLFAISSVSGSSLGAVVDRAALEEVTPRTMKVVDDVASGDLRERLRGLRKGGLA